MLSKIWDQIIYPFPNFNGTTVEVWKWISNFIPLYNRCNYLSMLELKLKRGPSSPIYIQCIPRNMVYTFTERKYNFWRNFHRLVHWNLSFWQHTVQPVTKKNKQTHSSLVHYKYLVHFSHGDILRRWSVSLISFEGQYLWYYVVARSLYIAHFTHRSTLPVGSQIPHPCH